jgi:hypothetical protein
MAESPKTLKEQYVPLEQRESQHPDWKPFVWQTVKFFVVAKLSAVAGYFVGNAMAKRNMKIGSLPIDGKGAPLSAAAQALFTSYTTTGIKPNPNASASIISAAT